jgi:hypothetical protein
MKAAGDLFYKKAPTFRRWGFYYQYFISPKIISKEGIEDYSHDEFSPDWIKSEQKIKNIDLLKMLFDKIFSKAVFIEQEHFIPFLKRIERTLIG